MIPIENSHLYSMHEFYRASVAPITALANVGKRMHSNPFSPFAYTSYGRHMAAASELLERMTKRYHKPEFGITHTKSGDKLIAIHEETVDATPFCRLLHFVRDDKKKLPKLLLVAPMSGHHATLLRGTVEGMLPYADVYITDWIDARDIPVALGDFDLDDYIEHVIRFTKLLGPDVHLMAVCQPSVPVMAAVSLMNAAKDPAAPYSMTLIGGPIDTRINPTKVNETATQRPLSWFEQNVITRVPFQYQGFMRRVYPGFLQLTGFMTMNLERHLDEHVKLFQHLVQGDGDSAGAHRKFYDEYLSVMDLPAEFYLQTLDMVFIKHALPQGEMISRDRKVDPGKITRTALLTLEGELDDISGVGQTHAAHNLCKHLAPEKKRHHMQKGVGHYGIFNGRKFREHVVPIIDEFIRTHNK